MLNIIKSIGLSYNYIYIVIPTILVHLKNQLTHMHNTYVRVIQNQKVGRDNWNNIFNFINKQ